jgi:hypothetical protein
MKAIAGHRFHSIEFKRKIAQRVVEYAVMSGEPPIPGRGFLASP